MGCSVRLTADAQADLSALDPAVIRRVIKKLQWLEAHPDPLSAGRPMRAPAAGDVRFRIGDYRLIAIFKRSRNEILVVRIGHRSEVYT